MRRRITPLRGLVAAACLAFAASAPGGALGQAVLPQTVRDTGGRFVMNFPADWDVVTRQQGMIVLLGAGPIRAGHRPSVNVVAEALSRPMSAQAYAEAAGGLAQTTLHNYTVIQESSATVQGRPAYYRYLTWETNTGVALYQLQVFLTDGETGYVITGSTINDRDRILQDMPLVTRIIQSFRLGPQ